MQQSAGAIIVTYDNRILLQRRDDKPELINPGKLAVFGGYLEDADESAETALIRELEEELGVIVTADELQLISDRIYKLPTDQIRIRHFLWFERRPRITGIYEGSAAYFASITAALASGAPIAGSILYSLEAAKPCLPAALR